MVSVMESKIRPCPGSRTEWAAGDFVLRTGSAIEVSSTPVSGAI
jgi:hypothetical protein